MIAVGYPTWREDICRAGKRARERKQKSKPTPNKKLVHRKPVVAKHVSVTKKAKAPPAKIYTAKLDSKKRITIRAPKYSYYSVTELDDGRIIMEPQVLVGLEDLSPETLAMIDSAMKNYKAGRVSGPIDLD